MLILDVGTFFFSNSDKFCVSKSIEINIILNSFLLTIYIGVNYILFYIFSLWKFYI